MTNRPIKFRAWDGEKMDYEPWFDEHLGGGAPANSFEDDERSFMQYTGLHDKNGNEIYEGDLVETPKGVGRVMWNTSRNNFRGEWRIEPADESEFYDCLLMECAVIGNLHEHPHLLES